MMATVPSALLPLLQQPAVDAAHQTCPLLACPQVCLKKGQPWEDGFADGLFDATVFVPVLSTAGLANFARLEADSPCDNVRLHVLQAPRPLSTAFDPYSACACVT